MNIKEELGNKIRKIRKQRGLTQEELSEKIEISSRNLSKIELGNSFPKPDTIEKIVQNLHISLQTLFENENIKTKDELIKEINYIVNDVKHDYKTLEIIYKVIKNITDIY